MERKDCVVVGAGFAGLTAAKFLANKGKSVCVLEARDRVGGRVRTEKRSDGTWIDLGGQWVGPTQERILTLLREEGFETFKTHTAGDNVLLVQGARSLYRGLIPRIEVSSLASFGLGQLAVDLLAKTVPLEAPWRARFAERMDRTTLGALLDQLVRVPTARKLFEAGLQTVFAESTHELSLLHALFYVHSGRNLDMLFGTVNAAQDERVEGGMQPVAEALARKLDVRLSQRVRSLTQTATGVLVKTDALEFEARRVIVALPPKLAAALQYEPALPPARVKVASSMPMGAVLKCTAIYDKPFWREEGLSGHSLSDEGPIHIVFDNSPPSGTPGVLMGFCEANEARRFATLSQSERCDETVRCFARVVGPRALEPRDYTDLVWEHEEFSGGCYGAFMPPGLLTSVGPALREPCGRLHWAGTETAMQWAGYIDGAMESGERAAREVLAAG